MCHNVTNTNQEDQNKPQSYPNTNNSNFIAIRQIVMLLHLILHLILLHQASTQMIKYMRLPYVCHQSKSSVLPTDPNIGQSECYQLYYHAIPGLFIAALQSPLCS